MYLIGITGPIAAGKSTVAKLYKEMGAYLLDADILAHKLYEIPAIRTEVIDSFGDEILDEKGEIDRTLLAKTVFEDIEKLELLNSIMEKPLTSKLRDRIIELEEGSFPGIVAIDAALLPRWELVKSVDLIILVDAPKWQRLNRLVRQRGLPPDEANKRIEVQEDIFKNFHPKQALLVKNNGDFVEIHANAMRVWVEIKKRAKEKTENL